MKKNKRNEKEMLTIKQIDKIIDKAFEPMKIKVYEMYLNKLHQGFITTHIQDKHMRMGIIGTLVIMKAYVKNKLIESLIEKSKNDKRNIIPIP